MSLRNLLLKQQKIKVFDFGIYVSVFVHLVTRIFYLYYAIRLTLKYLKVKAFFLKNK